MICVSLSPLVVTTRVAPRHALLEVDVETKDDPHEALVMLFPDLPCRRAYASLLLDTFWSFFLSVADRVNLWVGVPLGGGDALHHWLSFPAPSASWPDPSNARLRLHVYQGGKVRLDPHGPPAGTLPFALVFAATQLFDTELIVAPRGHGEEWLSEQGYPHGWVQTGNPRIKKERKIRPASRGFFLGVSGTSCVG